MRQVFPSVLLALLLLCGCAAQTPSSSPAASAFAPSESSASAEPAPSAEASAFVEPEQSAPPAPPALTVEDVNAMPAGSVLPDEDLSALDTDQLFFYEELSDAVFARMEGVSFGEECTTPRADLRYVRVLHHGMDDAVHIGELVVNQAIAEDVTDIFRELYEQSYPIEKMLLIDEYGGDDERSMEDNNTSCFNFRIVSGTDHLSQHAYGLAIDVNPLYNPYITASGYEPLNAGDYVDRSAEIPCKIDESDLCYQLFTERGFTWGGSWNSVKDYQHFQRPLE